MDSYYVPANAHVNLHIVNMYNIVSSVYRLYADEVQTLTQKHINHWTIFTIQYSKQNKPRWYLVRSTHIV